MVQLRCNYARVRAIYSYSRAIYPSSYRATHGKCFITREPRGTHVSLLDDPRELFLIWSCMLTVIDHHNVLRLVLGLVSRSQNLSQSINSLVAYNF